MTVLLRAPHDHGHGHGHGGHSHHGNPDDLAGYIAKLEEPGRAEWQQPDEVVAALALMPGQTVCEIGGGTGYFALRIARAIGPAGMVLAVEVEPKLLEVLRSRVEQSEVRNVLPVLALPGDPLLAEQSCDLILMVNSFHHLPEPERYLGRLRRALKPGGRLVNIDFKDEETPVGPPIEFRVPREKFVSVAASAGLSLVSEPAFLPYQYFLVLAPERQP